MFRLRKSWLGLVDAANDSAQQAERGELKRREPNTLQDGYADIQAHIIVVIYCRQLEAAADDADESEDDEVDPTRASTETMANSQEDGDCESGNIDGDLANSHAVPIVDIHGILRGKWGLAEIN
jgi:hypothetical protein